MFSQALATGEMRKISLVPKRLKAGFKLTKPMATIRSISLTRREELPIATMRQTRLRLFLAQLLAMMRQTSLPNYNEVRLVPVLALMLVAIAPGLRRVVALLPVILMTRLTV